MSTIINHQIDYTKRESLNSQLRFGSIQPDTNSSVNIGTSSNQTKFFIPGSSAYNLSKFKFYFLANFGESGVDRYNWATLDLIPWFSEIKLQTSNGVELMTLSSADLVSKVIRTANLSMEKDQSSFSSINGIGALTTTMLDNAYDPTVDRPTGQPYLRSSGAPLVVTPGAVNAPSPILRYEYVFSKVFKDTIMGLDKTLFFQHDLILSFVWNDRDSIGWRGDANIDPSSVVSLLIDDIDISLIELITAIETNQKVVNDLVTRINKKGFSVLVDFPYIERKSLTGTSQTATFNALNRANGRAIKALYASAFNSVLALNTIFDNSNEASIRWTNINGVLNGSQLEDSNLDIYTAYAHILPYLKSKIDFDSWVNSAVYIKRFDDNSDFADGNLFEGLELTNRTITLGVRVSQAASSTWLLIAVVQRELLFDKRGVTWI